jgi:hypothetical protein
MKIPYRARIGIPNGRAEADTTIVADDSVVNRALRVIHFFATLRRYSGHELLPCFAGFFKLTVIR